MAGKLIWYLENRAKDECGTGELRGFMLHLVQGHEEAGGRYGGGESDPRLYKPLSSCTLKDYHTLLGVWSKWMVAEEIADSDLMARVSRPRHNSSQVQPFTRIRSLHCCTPLRAATFRAAMKRLSCFCWIPACASELCALRMTDLDVPGRSAIVRGKGDKTRLVHFERTTARALPALFRETRPGPRSPVFASCRGGKAGGPLTRSGLLQIIERLGRSARLQAVRCSPHTFRHTFAVTFLRAGGNVFSLQQALGHTNLAMTNRYVKFAEADLENQHRMFSPVEHLTRQRKEKQ